MVETDYYEIIRQKLKLGDLYAPKHKKVFDLLKLFWNEEEAELLSHFNSCDKATSLRQLMKRTGMERDKIKEILRGPLRKKTITKIGSKYTLLPLLPGIFEQYFIRRNDTKENLKKVAEIYRYLFKNFLPSFYTETDFKLFRPRLPLDAKEKLIKVDETLDVENQVLSFELIEDIIEKNEYFTTVPCQCRLIGELTGDPCDQASSELGCFLTGIVAKSIIDAGGKSMTKEEAIEFMKKTEEAGLVHNCVADSSLESSLVICNCCSCHCGTLIPAKEHKTVATVPSNFQPQFSDALCTQCEICLNKCPMQAIYHHWPGNEDKSDDHMYLKEEFCIGCGVCAANCPNDAIKLVKVGDREFKERHKIGNKSFLQLLM